MSVRVLVVEDEAIVALDIADQLIEVGFLVVGPAPSVAKALKLIEQVGCDVAVLDVNLRDETAEPVARELRSRRLPFLFLSAVSRGEIYRPVLPTKYCCRNLLARRCSWRRFRLRWPDPLGIDLLRRVIENSEL